MREKSVKFYLYFNTLRKRKKIFLLNMNGDVKGKLYFSSYNWKEDILVYLNKILNKERVDIFNICGIIVNKGPGSFTSIRKILTIVNILSWILKIPAIGFSLKQGDSEKKAIDKALEKIKKTKPQTPVSPFYGKGLGVRPLPA